MPPNKNIPTDMPYPVQSPHNYEITGRHANRRGQALLALAASAVTAMGVGVYMSGDASDPSSSHLERPPAATAEPFEHAPDISLPPTTIPPAPEGIPAPVIVPKPKEMQTTTTTVAPNVAMSEATVQPEAKKPVLLDQETVTQISKKMGYKGFEGREFELGEVIETDNTTVKILKLDGAEQSVTTDKLSTYLDAVEKLADQQVSFSTDLQLGTGTATEITFEASSNDLSPKDNIHYVIFVAPGQSLDELTSPIKGFPEASTKVLPYENLSVTLLRDVRGQERDGLPSNEYNALTEMIVANLMVEMNADSIAKVDSGKIDMSNLDATALQDRKWELNRLGTDIFANSEASAILHAKEGTSYSSYASKVKNTPMRAFAKLKAFLYPVPAERYKTAA
jgi:hypothetical protein